MPFSTSTANTVFGTEALYQLEASKPAAETASPPELTFAEDCTVQPSRKVISPSARETRAAIVAAVRSPATRVKAARRSPPFLTIRATHSEKKFSFLQRGIIVSSRH